jgi:predicted permease
MNDLRHGLRVLLKARGSTAIVVASLALGIGANLALFGAVDGLLLRTIPVRHPEELVRLRYAGRNEMVTDASDYGTSRPIGGEPVRATFSFAMFEALRAANQTMSDMLACATFGRVNVSLDGSTDVASAFIASGNYFQMLGVPARLGRTFVPDDDRPGAAPVAVVSSRYWQSRLGGDPGAVGRTVAINNVPVTIIGVLPAGFTGIQMTTMSDAENRDVTVPLAIEHQLSGGGRPDAPPARASQPTMWWLEIVGRLKPGVTPAQVEANLGATFRQTARAGLDQFLSGLSDEERQRTFNRERSAVPRLIVDTASHGVYEVGTADMRSVTILGVVVALVLLVVCANVANVLLSRAVARRREIAVRLSLGATRGRIVRQLLVESLMLSLAGAGLGVVIGRWGEQFFPGALGRVSPPDWRIVAFVAAIAVATAVIFGLAPAVRASRFNLNAALKEGGRGASDARSRLGRALLVAQVAISVVVLIGAGLLLQTLDNLRRVDVGFDPDNIAVFRLAPRLNGYDDARMAALYARVIDRLHSVPGVRAAAFSQPGLLSGIENSGTIFVSGHSYAREERHSINRLVVTPDFAEVMGIRLVAGRAFGSRDAGEMPKVAIINETAARRYFGGANPVGQRFGFNPEESSAVEVVGVLSDAKYNSLRDPAPPTMYVPYLQNAAANPTFAVRTAADPLAAVASIREAVRQIDPNLPVTDVSTQTEQISRRYAQEKALAQAYALFGALALIVASIGVFGLMSYNVARRTNEIGIRMALGAQAGAVLRSIVGESLRLTAAGAAVGIAVALAGSRLVASVLFGVAPTDALTMAAAVIVMLCVAALAGFVPARRASRVDPLIALRSE